MSLEKHLKLLFDDIIESSELQTKDSDQFFKTFSLSKPMIGVGDGRMIYISQKGAKAVKDIATIVRDNSLALRASLSELDMANLTSRTIGELIAGDTDKSITYFPAPEDIDSFKKSLLQRIEKRVHDLDIFRTHVFGAWVFQGAPFKSLHIGPVELLLREIWLQRSAEEKLLNENQASRIAKLWKENLVPDPIKKDIEYFREKDVIDTVGPCPWICSVKIHGHSLSRSREKAIIAARIAISTIGLSWQKPSSSALETGLLIDLGPHRVRTVFSHNGPQFISSSRESSHRLGWFLDQRDASEFLSQSRERLQTVGAAIETFLSTNPKSRKANLESILCRSLMWFNEACREPLDFVAIVKFSAALDSLANGKKSKGICQLVSARFPIKDMKAKFLQDGTSAESLVRQIYDTGRSQIVHGTRPSLTEDFDKLRARAEALATWTLRASISWLHQYEGPDQEDAYRSAG